MKAFAFFIIIILSGCVAGSGTVKNKVENKTALPVLTREQMYQDFDQMAFNLTNILPRIGLKRILMGVDVVAGTGVLRKEIESIASTGDFINLLDRLIMLQQDFHTGIVFFYDKNDRMRDAGLEYFRMLPNYPRLISLRIPLVYVNGRYSVFADFTNRGTHVPRGAVIRTIDGDSANDFARKHLDDKVFLWDGENRTLFNSEFYVSGAFYRTSNFFIDFTADITNDIRCDFSITDRVRFNPPRTDSVDRTNIYFPSRKTMYLRVKECRDSAYYTDFIKKTFSSNRVDRVLIDIRDNRGGETTFFTEILQSLLPEPLDLEFRIGLKNDDPGVLSGAVMTNTYGIYGTVREGWTNIACLEGERFFMVRDNSRILPKESSVRYRGRVYILQNETIYSSGKLISDLANFSSNIVTVGMPARYEQSGAAAYWWQDTLTNTGLRYCTVKNIDLTGVRGKDDLLHNKVKIRVEYTLDDYIKRYYRTAGLYSEEYLFNVDPLVKEAMRD